MDLAKHFKPKQILLWHKVSDHPTTKRLLSNFPDTPVRIIESQRITPINQTSMADALLNGKSTLMIGETQSFISYFSGDLGRAIRCCPDHKLTPLSNGCPYTCTYCYLAFVYRKFSPFIKLNINFDTMFKQIRKTISSSNRRTHFNMGEAACLKRVKILASQPARREIGPPRYGKPPA